MAEVKNNILVKGFSGTVGRELTFRQIGGRTFVSKYQKAPGVPPTDKKRSAQNKFSTASAFAKRVIGNPELKALYQTAVTGGQRAFNIALSDALQSPVVENIQIENYKGNAGDQILIRAIDNFKVVRVAVSIKNLQGILIEQGDAVMNADDPNEWVYYAKLPNVDYRLTLVTAEATDLPGNIGYLGVRL